MTSSSRRDTMSSGNSSSFSVPQNQQKKQIPGYEVRFTNKNHPFMWLVCKTRAKILLSDPERSLTTPRLLPLRQSRRSWKLPIAPVFRIVSKYLKRLGRSGRSGRSYGKQALLVPLPTSSPPPSPPKKNSSRKRPLLVSERNFY